MKLHLLALLLLPALLCAAAPAKTPLRLAGIFGSHMVLQRDVKVPVWGTVAPGEKVKVEIAGQTRKAKADKEGKWNVLLEPLKVGAPLEMKVTAGNESLILKDILVGEVWLCSGQSNMEMQMRELPCADSAAAAATRPEIRLFKVAEQYSTTVKADIDSGHWKAALGDSIRDFSAVGYFFGRNLADKFGVPVGLIGTYWGGTQVESWTSREGLAKFPDFAPLVNEMATSPGIYEKARAARIAALKQWVEVSFMQGEGMAQKWYAPETDLAGWISVKVPSKWDKTGLSDYQGTVWYKTWFEVSSLNRGKNLRLLLGALSKFDIAWVNGVRVGTTIDQWQPRDYVIPAGILKDGRNDLTVRITNRVGAGGFSMDRGYLMICADTAGYPSKDVYLLNNEWKMKKDDGLNAASLPIRPDTGFGPNALPSLLYNAMIAPLATYAIRGAIWYQGESNADRAFEYRKLFPAMISDWRAKWGQGDFPFLYVQLANFNNGREPKKIPGQSAWAELREAQNQALLLPNVGMAVAVDIGDANDIHPKNKAEVGRRLFIAARKTAYGENIVPSGPLYRSMEVNGNTAVLHFDHVGSGLASSSGTALSGFSVAGADQKFVWAEALVSGESVTVRNDQVKVPVAVRYAWADNPEPANLVNKEGLPASPFRTDNWAGLTDTVTFMKLLNKTGK